MFQAPRGTRDVLPNDFALREHVMGVARHVAALTGYRFMEPPTFEAVEVFARGVGAGTDIVEKEMYVFEDRGGDRLALRPEGTASICRAYLQHGMANEPQPVKLCYQLPIFRYERPQAGRFRQHTQFGVEALGVLDPALDAEVIDLGWRITQDLGLRNLKVLINTIGDREDRASYVPKLKAHFQPHLDKIAPEDRARFERAPMRLLDSKDERTKPFQVGAPLTVEHMKPESRAIYESVKAHLQALEIPFEERPSLVRGLDYYTHTVFEVVPEDEAGQQVTVFGGGRYDALIEELGGPPTPGIGFGMGLERMALNLVEQGLAPDSPPGPPVFVATLGEGASAFAAKLAAGLRRRGVGATQAFGGRSLKAQMRQANNTGARLVVIVGERELAEGTVTLRDLGSAEQRAVPAEQALDELLRAATYTEDTAEG